MATEDLKSQILLASQEYISAVIRAKLKNSLVEDFNYLKIELQPVWTEQANNAALARNKLDKIKATIKDMEGGISMWSDEVVELQTTVTTLTKEMKELKDWYGGEDAVVQYSYTRRCRGTLVKLYRLCI